MKKFFQGIPRPPVLLKSLAPVVLGICWAALLAAGCALVGPDYSRPEAQVNEAWREAQDGRVSADQPVTKQWWKLFGDPVLESLVLQAYQDSLDLRQAGLRVLEARAQLAVAVGALYPQTQQISGSAAYSVPSQRAASAPQPGLPGGATSFWQDSLGLNLGWELDFWGKYRRGVESYQAALESQVADYDNALVSLSAQVATSYVTLRTAQRRLFIAQHNVEVQQEGLQIAQARYRHGATSELDVQQALNILHATRATIPDLQKSMRLAEDALSFYLGRPPSQLPALQENQGAIPSPPAQVATGIPADLLRRRPDIRKAEREAAVQCARVGVAQADLYPSFSLSGNVGFQASNVGVFGLADLVSARAFTAGFTPSFTWNIFNYGQIVNKVRVQDAKLEQALTDYQAKVLNALREVEDALVAFLRAQDQSALLSQAAEAAKRAVELSYAQYREGQTYYTTVLVAQQNLLSAQDNLASAQGAIALGLINLFKGLGGGWELRQGQDFVPNEVRRRMAERTDWGALLAPPDRQAQPLDHQAPRSLAPVW